MKFGSKNKRYFWEPGSLNSDIFRKGKIEPSPDIFGLLQINHSRFLIVSFSSLGLLRVHSPAPCLCDFFSTFDELLRLAEQWEGHRWPSVWLKVDLNPPSLGEHFNHCGILALYNNVLNLLSLNKGSLKNNNNRNLGLNGVIANNNQSFICVSLTYGSSAGRHGEI